LAYADNLVLLTKNEESIKKMRRLERYLKDKNLQLNTEKSKMLCFRKERGRRRIVKWMWKGKEIEEMSELKYLGYVLKKNGETMGKLEN